MQWEPQLGDHVSYDVEVVVAGHAHLNQPVGHHGWEGASDEGVDEEVASRAGAHVDREQPRSGHEALGRAGHDEARDAFLHAWPKVRRRKWRRWAR